MGLWCYRFLSLGGRLILTKAVLESIPVYWLSLFKIPVSILEGIRKRMSPFLWSGGILDDKIHLVRWNLLARPKSMGGWGLRRLDLFSLALRMKSLWRSMFSDTLWNKIIKDKYLRNQSVTSWLTSERVVRHNSSPIWRGFLDAIPIIRKSLSWQIGSGQLFRVGIDSFVGNTTGVALFEELIHIFQARGYSQLDHFCTHSADRRQYWLGPHYFNLTGVHKEEWSSYLVALYRSGITLNGDADKLVWSTNYVDGSVTSKIAYDYLIKQCGDDSGHWWATELCSWPIPIKLICFFWLVLHNRILTWDNLGRGGWKGPAMCCLCHEAEESILHLFFRCRFAQEVWRIICTSLNVVWQNRIDSVEGLVQHWFRTNSTKKGLVIFICWGLWRSRNSFIFDDIAPDVILTCNQIMGFYKDYWNQNHRSLQKRRVIAPFTVLAFPAAFFDGAAQGPLGGVGIRILLTSQHFTNLWMGIDACTNNFSEVVALWTCLYWVKRMDIQDIRVFGDSRVVIDWVNGKADIHSLLLQHWCSHIKGLVSQFSNTSFQHVYREYNKEADQLSKRGLSCTMGSLYFEEYLGSTVISNGVHILY